MSLAVLADHMASKGRGPDSMLIHMSPREVQGLQALAKANGGSLTVNPDTGLPEAGFLDKLLPTIIGAGLTFFSGGAINPMMAAGIVGGIQTARTGDIGKGLAAGLGAYGGAGLTAGLSEAGASSLGAGEAAKGLNMTPELAGELMNAGAGETAAATNNALQQQVTERVAAATPYEKLSAGFDAAKTNPTGFAKSMASPLMMAAGPAIMAGANVQAKGPQTVTKPGRITPYSYDPYGGGYVAASPYEAAPTRAAEGGLMGMAQGGMFDFAQRSEPVVRMAEGGIASYAPGGVTDQQVFDWFKANPTAKDTDIAAAMQQYDVSPEQIARATGTMDKLPEYNTRFVQAIAQPNIDTSEFMAAAQDVGLQNQGLANALQNSGLSAGAQYALTHQNIGMPENVAETQGGLEGLSSNINYAVNALRGAGTTGADARAAALAEMNKYGLNEADVLRATGKTVAELFPDQIKKVAQVVTPPAVKTTTPADVIPDGYYGSGPSTGVDYKGATVSTATPGDITTNPDRTVTIQPNIPGRPTGGFTGMDAVKSAYTAGGGSLGYIPYVPKTIEEFESKYNKLTGGSKQSYDYLMGKTPYSPTPYTPTGEVMKPYAESVLGMPANLSKKMYLFDPATKTYKINPDYAIPTYDKDGKKTYNVTNKDVLTYMATKPAPSDFYNWAKTNNLTIEQIAAATGMPITEVQKMFSGGAPADTATKGESSTQISDGMATGGLAAMARGGSTQYNLGDYSDGGRLLRGPGDGVSDSIPASIGNKRPARLADGEFVVPARIVSELGNGSTEAGARKLYAMMDRIQSARRGTVGKGKVAKNSRADKHLPA